MGSLRSSPNGDSHWATHVTYPDRLRQPHPDFWHRPDVVAALDSRDMGALLRRYRAVTGASQTDVGLLVGLAQSHISALERGRRRVTSLDLFERFADGLGIPRGLIGLDEPDVPGGRHGAAQPPSDVGRRAVLRTVGMAATAVGMAADELLSLLESDEPRIADPRATDAFAQVLHRAASLGPPVKPVHIAPTVVAVLEGLVRAQAHPTSPALHERMGQLIADAACFAGWLEYDRGRLASARAYFALAAEAAQDAGDVTRSALVQASRGASYSPAIDGGVGDARRAYEMLAAADATLAAQPPHRAHAWLNANAAARAARAGDARLFAVHRERALQLQGQQAEPTSGLWHWFPPRSVDEDWLDDYLCGGLVQLDDPSAEPILRGIVERTTHGHRLADAHKLLMELHLSRGEHDAAAAAGLASLTAARAAGLERQDKRIRGLRARAPDATPAYAELDAALADVSRPPVRSTAASATARTAPRGGRGRRPVRAGMPGARRR